ncbi:nuclear receptor subfamily 1 group I member 3-like [Ptychodera flava]|uniref:nuclear receptor subfamily 1 group I member 3-like n=1 Tax=Ptychodera flava TaxID=63121 RepID=UPI00396A7AF4
MMRLLSKHVHCVLRFATKLPGFCSLPHDDQITMVNNGVFQIVMVVLANFCDKTEIINNYLFMTEDEIQKVMMVFPEIGILNSCMKSCKEALSLLKLDDVEYALLNALQLISTDWPELTSRAPIENLQDKLCLALEEYCSGKRSAGYDQFGMILLVIRRLQHVADIYHNCLRQLRHKIPHV